MNRTYLKHVPGTPTPVKPPPEFKPADPDGKDFLRPGAAAAAAAASVSSVSVDPYSPRSDDSPGMNRTWLEHVEGDPTPSKPPPVFNSKAQVRRDSFCNSVKRHQVVVHTPGFFNITLGKL